MKKGPIYLDPSQPLANRIQDLLSQMTVEEKASQMLHRSPGVPRLGIPEYNWWNECLHGVARAGLATVFPQAIGLGATFDEDLALRVASAISDEARAKHHHAVSRGNRGQYAGLTFWTTNINIFRDPRWGRGQETYGEDPFLTARLGTAFVRGLQGNTPGLLKTAACAKHFAVHSGPEALRHSFDARVSPKDLQETYLPAFRALVEAGVEAVMGAYNRVNGEPACASTELLVDNLRGQWGFEGHVVSDCWAISDFHLHHNVTESPEKSVELAIKRGCDLNCGNTYEHALAALRLGLLSEADIDRSVARLLRTRFRLGMFDPPERVPYASIPVNSIHSGEHIALAREVATKSFVLLRNQDNLLPLSRDLSRVYVLGPNAASIDALIGNYYGSSDRYVTILEGIVAKLGPNAIVDYRRGIEVASAKQNPNNWAMNEAAACDVTIAVMGLDNTLEGEEGDAIASANRGDRDTIELPEHQVQFLRGLKEKAARTVLVLTGGSPIAFPEDIADAIIFAWYPGETGRAALADILFGDAAPSGRLPVTFPRATSDLPPYEEYSMVERTYRYSTKPPLYPFGFGLSYTQFEYTDLRVDVDDSFTAASDRAADGGKAGSGASPRSASSVAEVQVTVRNTGTVAAEEVVQVYLTDLVASVNVPLYSLVAFRRVRLGPGESTRLRLDLGRSAFEIVDEMGRRLVEPGEFRFTVGGVSPGPRAAELGAAQPAVTVVRVG